MLDYGHVRSMSNQQRELCNEIDTFMRALEDGDSFIVTRNGVPVATLTPLREQMFSKKADVIGAFRNAPHIDYAQFRADLDRYSDQCPETRTQPQAGRTSSAGRRSRRRRGGSSRLRLGAA